MFSIRNKSELIGDLRGILHLFISKGLTQENIRVCKTRLYSILIIPLFVRELRIFCAQTHPYCNPTDACCQIFFLCGAAVPRIFALNEELTSDGAAHRFSFAANGTGMWRDDERFEADPPPQADSPRCNLALHPTNRHRGARAILIHFSLVKIRTHKSEGANVNIQKGVFCE